MNHADRWERGFNWPPLLLIVLLHAGALAAPFFFTFKALVLAVVLYAITGGFGISIGFHRYFTHRSFRTYRPICWFLAIIGNLAGEGPLIHWVATHRKHHAFSDEEEDPHSPMHGKWWAHLLWFLPWMSKEEQLELHRRWTQDLLRDRVMRLLNSSYMVLHLALGVLLYFLGWFFWDHYTAISFLLWGVALRTVCLLHATWAVNSATHLWGYKNYETRDNSRNLWWVALITFGEGWHNNHHAHPAVANHGHHRWWEIDVSYLTIRLMEKLGLAWRVRRKALS